MSCLTTYIGLCIYSKTFCPEEISSILGMEPTRTTSLDPNSKYKPTREQHLWVWSTRSAIDSTDHIVHLNHLFEALAGKDYALEELRNGGCSMQVSCYWESDGHGGPWLDLPTINSLSKLKLEIWWDIYFVSEESSGDA